MDIKKQKKNLNQYWLIAGIIISVVLIVASRICCVRQEQQIREVSVAYTEEQKSEKEKEYEEGDNYSDNIFPLSVSVLVAVETISITIFIFLKSLLDRNTDERNYSKKIMSSYNKQMSMILEILTIYSIILLVYGFYFYSSRFFEFKYGYGYWFLGWLIPVFIYTLCSFRFWHKCIDINKSWKIIAQNKINEEEVRVYNLMYSDNDPALINKFNHMECNIEWEHFTHLFTKLEEFLVLGIDAHYSVYTDVEEQIRHYLEQDEKVINSKLNGIEAEDLKGEPVFEEIHARRKKLAQAKLDIPQLYQSLESYRDFLLVDSLYTGKGMEQVKEKIHLTIALKLFYQKVLMEKIRNLVIDGIISENPIFVYIDLYGARLENSVLTGVYFLKAVLARMQIENTNMTIGKYDNVLLKDVRAANSSFLSSEFLFAKIQRTKFIDVEFSNSNFVETEILDSAFLNSNLSDSEFKDTEISRVDFTDTILHNIEFTGKTSIKDCSFVRAEINQWKIGAEMLKSMQNFTEAVMKGFRLGDPYKCIDASGDIFKGAKIYEGRFKNLFMEGCIFENCNMTRIEMENVNASSSNMRGVNLYKAKIRGVFPELSTKASFGDCDLTDAIAINADIINTDFRGAICMGMDLSETKIVGGDWAEARLEKAVISKAHIMKVNFEKTDFTDAVIENTEFIRCDFEDAVFHSTHISKVIFRHCNFRGTDFEEIKGSGFQIENCIIDKDITIDLTRERK